MTEPRDDGLVPGRLADCRFVGLRPGHSFLALPATPRRALWSGLGLYDGVEPMQRAVLLVARILVAGRLHWLLPGNTATGVDWDWWESWIEHVGAPMVGPVDTVAIRIPPNGRTCMLLMDRKGTPTGFVKLLAGPLPEFSATVRTALRQPALRSVRVPATLEEGAYRGRDFVLFEPMAPGPHRRPPFDPEHVASIVDEWRERLRNVPRPAHVPAHHEVCHTGFTPRNVRVAGGEWWLFDWDNVTWGPRVTPELRYWCADFTYRLRVDVHRAARNIYDLLRQRAGDEDIVEAATWAGTLPTYRATERVLRAEVGYLAGAMAEPSDVTP